MKRIPEEELMDDDAQASAYAETDFSEPHEAFVSYFRERFPGFLSGEVLDLGCGTGDVIIRFARALPDIHITGVDGSDAMLDIASHNIIIQGLSDRISLKKHRLPDTDLMCFKYDSVISNSILHHLSDPSALWETIKSCSKKNASILIMDLFRPDSIDTAKSLVDQYASEASSQLKKDFYNSLLAAYTPDEISDQLEKADLDTLKIEVVSDRHVLVWGELS